MSMPETPVNENYASATSKYQIRLSRKFRVMEPVPIACSVELASNKELDLGIL